MSLFRRAVSVLAAFTLTLACQSPAARATTAGCAHISDYNQVHKGQRRITVSRELHSWGERVDRWHVGKVGYEIRRYPFCAINGWVMIHYRRGNPLWPYRVTHKQIA